MIRFYPMNPVPRIPKTWSVVAEKLGGHWHADVRRGHEGSRGLCGRLTFDLSDVEDLVTRIDEISDRIATRAITATFEQLEATLFLPAGSAAAWAEMSRGVEAENIIRAACRPLARELVAAWFNLTIKGAPDGDPHV